MHQFTTAVDEYYGHLQSLESRPQVGEREMEQIAICAGKVCEAYHHCLRELEDEQGDAARLKRAYLAVKKCAVISSFEELARRYGLPAPEHQPARTKPSSGTTPSRRSNPSGSVDEQMPFWESSGADGWNGKADQGWQSAMSRQVDQGPAMTGQEISLRLEQLPTPPQRGGAWDVPPGAQPNQPSSSNWGSQMGMLNTAGDRNEAGLSDFRPQVVIQVWVKDGCPDCAQYLSGLQQMLQEASQVYNERYRLAWTVYNERLHRDDPALRQITRFPSLVVMVGREGDLRMVGRPIMGNRPMSEIKSQIRQTIDTAVPKTASQ